MVGIAFAFSCATFIVSLVLFTTFLLIDKNNVLTANKVCFFLGFHHETFMKQSATCLPI